MYKCSNCGKVSDFLKPEYDISGEKWYVCEFCNDRNIREIKKLKITDVFEISQAAVEIVLRYNNMNFKYPELAAVVESLCRAMSNMFEDRELYDDLKTCKTDIDCENITNYLRKMLI